MIAQSSRANRPAHDLMAIVVWLPGLLAVATIYAKTHDRMVNVVNYDVVEVHAPQTPLSFAAPLLTLAALLFIVIQRYRARLASASEFPPSMSAARAGIPLALPLLVAGSWLLGLAPSFVALTAAIVGLAWSIDRLGRGVRIPDGADLPKFRATVVLVVVLLMSTVWHTFQQINFWQHFLLGYADFGLFTTELEHCLPWKDVGATRFSDTRMGYHCVPMFYLLVPFYAVFRSPVFLMAVGSFALNLAAIPFYQLAKHRTGSATIGLLVGLAWLALPSLSRLPYSNTYGFQSIYLAVPWLAWAFSLAMRGRWRGSHICLAAAMLCEETVCGVALGWGCYLFIRGKGEDRDADTDTDAGWRAGGRRRDGGWIVAASILYLLLCTTVIIPTFQGAGEYTRLMLFGDLSVANILDRLTRPRVPLYLLALFGPLFLAALRQWRILIVAAPTLGLVLMMHQTDYLNIKYWHHASVLPVLFVAATMGVCNRRIQRVPLGDAGDAGGAPSRSRSSGSSLGAPLGLAVGVLLFQLWMGSTPFAQSRRVYSASELLRTPDPRMAAVDYVRSSFSSEETTVIATERMAAHFTDYRMVYPAPLIRLAGTTGSPHVLIIDRSDRWDKIVMEGTLDQTLAQAADAGYAMVREIGSVLVLANELAQPRFPARGRRGRDWPAP